MFLEIDCDDPIGAYDFAVWIVNDIREFASDNDLRNYSLEEYWDNYFQNNDFGWYRDGVGDSVVPTVNFIINAYFSNLIIIKKDKSLVITVDPNIKINQTDVPIELLATIINYGTLTETPYPYFDYVFDLYAENIDNLYSTWVGLISE